MRREEATAMALWAFSIVVIMFLLLNPSGTGGGGVKSDVEERLTTLLYSTLEVGGLRCSVGEAVVHYLRDGGTPPTSEIEKRLSFLFPEGYSVTFYVRGGAGSLKLGHLQGGEEHLYTYHFLGERLDVIIRVGGGAK